MMGNARFIIWAHRSTESIFGAASNPVNRDGAILAFDSESHALEECARLNARSGNSNVRYSVKCEAEGKLAN